MQKKIHLPFLQFNYVKKAFRPGPSLLTKGFGNLSFFMYSPEQPDPKQPCNSSGMVSFLADVTKLIGADVRELLREKRAETPQAHAEGRPPAESECVDRKSMPILYKHKKMRAQSIRPGPHSIISTLITLHFQHVSSSGTYRQAGYQLLYIRLLPRYEDHAPECLGCMIRIRLY